MGWGEKCFVQVVKVKFCSEMVGVLVDNGERWCSREEKSWSYVMGAKKICQQGVGASFRTTSVCVRNMCQFGVCESK